VKTLVAHPGGSRRILVALVIFGVLATGGYWLFHTRRNSLAQDKEQAVVVEPADQVNAMANSASLALPPIVPVTGVQTIARKANLQTIIPKRKSQQVVDYVVAAGDSIFEIASKFKIKPETVLWANYDQLNDNPDTISIGMQLKVPPADGVYYQVKSGDSLQKIAGQFEVQTEDILTWSDNHLDLTDPRIETDSWLFVPGGHREFRQWVIPVIPRGAAGVSKSLYGGGACSGPFDGAYGTGSFIWPASNHYLSGNDYWSGHLGIDIAAGDGAAVYAADSGVVVFSGWATGGYGNTVMIDHGNGYQTLYAHLSSTTAKCGRSVLQGQVIAIAGNTGNSTGPHLHFEVRYQGGFVNPWFVLPAP
jgi:murein DD-endopeptidase MepM/ murein hydrolase activator NlpD